MRGIAERGRSLPLEDFLDGFGCFPFGESGAIADTENMRIDGKGFGPERDVEDDVRRLATDPGEGFEQVAINRYVAAMPIDKDLRERDDVLCLVIEQADGLDVIAHNVKSKVEHGLRIVGFGEQRAGGLVDADIGGLRGQHHGHQKRVDVD